MLYDNTEKKENYEMNQDGYSCNGKDVHISLSCTLIFSGVFSHLR